MTLGRNVTLSTGWRGHARPDGETDFAMEILPPVTAEEEAAAWGWVSDAAEHKAFSELEQQILMGSALPAKSGVAVTDLKAVQVATVYACLRVIAEDIAKLTPFHLKEERLVGDRVNRRVVFDHPVARLFRYGPNEWQSPYEFVEYMTFMAALHGDAYAYKTRDEDGRILELLPLLPGSVQIERLPDWSIRFWLFGYGEARVVEPTDLFRVSGPTWDGVQPFRPLLLAREAIGLASAIEAAASRFHANDLRPSGILTYEKGIAPETVEKIRSEWRAKFAPGGEGGIAVLDKDFKFTPIHATAADSQLIENRKHQIEEICRFFRVHPQKIGHATQAQGYGSVEQFNIAHAQDCLQPWVTRWEQAMDRDLLTQDERHKRGLRVDIDMRNLARGTFSDRVNAYRTAVGVYLTPNEIRAMEGLDPIEDQAMDIVQLPANNTGVRPGQGRIEPGKPGADAAAEAEPETEPASGPSTPEAIPENV